MLRLQLTIVLIIALMSSVHSQELPAECFTTMADSMDCEWYTKCLEKKYQCGSKGYPLDYGYFFCQRFGKLRSYPQVEQWVVKTTKCLKVNLVPFLQPNVTMTCKKLMKEAFNTHPVCYSDGGFCELFPELGFKKSAILLKQLMGVYGFKAFTSALAVMQVFDMGKMCLNKWM